MEAGLDTARPGLTASELNSVIQRPLIETEYEQYSREARGHGTGHETGMDPEEESPCPATRPCPRQALRLR